jgi:hypothetical protein
MLGSETIVPGRIEKSNTKGWLAEKNVNFLTLSFSALGLR